jgi:hypothetical protein
MVKTATKPVILNFTGDENAVKGIIVPDGGKLFVVKTRVDPAWQWGPMLKEACPDYQSRDVQRVADLYPPQPGEPKDCYVYGLNFGKSIPDTQPAVDWGKAQDNLNEAGPRHIYSVARDVPDLNKKVDMSWMYLVAPKFVTFDGKRRVCYASFFGSEREAHLRWFDGDWYGHDWFGFFRECVPSA